MQPQGRGGWYRRRLVRRKRRRISKFTGKGAFGVVSFQ